MRAGKQDRIYQIAEQYQEALLAAWLRFRSQLGNDDVVVLFDDKTKTAYGVTRSKFVAEEKLDADMRQRIAANPVRKPGCGESFWVVGFNLDVSDEFSAGCVRVSVNPMS